MAILTVALRFEELGTKLENVELKELGRQEDQGQGQHRHHRGRRSESDIKGRIESIKREIDTTTSDYDKESSRNGSPLSGNLVKVTPPPKSP
jgi:hypothetical protein